MKFYLLLSLQLVYCMSSLAGTVVTSRLNPDGTVSQETTTDNNTPDGFVHNVLSQDLEDILQANACLHSINSLPGSLSSGVLLFDGVLDKPLQILTTDKSLLDPGSVSAVIGPNGQVIQIKPNGSCALNGKKFKNAYEYVANGLWEPKVADTMGQLTTNLKNKKYIKENCSKLPNRGPFISIRNALVKAGLVDPISSNDPLSSKIIQEN